MAFRLSLLVLAALVAFASATAPTAPAPAVVLTFPPSSHETGEGLYSITAFFTGVLADYSTKKDAIDTALDVALLAIGVDCSIDTTAGVGSNKNEKFTPEADKFAVIISVVGAKKSAKESKSIVEKGNWSGYTASSVIVIDWNAASAPQLMMWMLALVAFATYMAI
jgi:hypothetical protein